MSDGQAVNLGHEPPSPGASDPWQVFDLNALRGTLGGSSVEYLDFLNTPSISCGLYNLPAGSKDMQAPHDDDEVYLVLAGKARMKLGNDEHEVGPGNLLYVSAATEHSFFEIEEDMTLLVLFTPSPLER